MKEVKNKKKHALAIHEAEFSFSPELCESLTASFNHGKFFCRRFVLPRTS